MSSVGHRAGRAAEVVQSASTRGRSNRLDSACNPVYAQHERYVDGDVHTNTIKGFWSHLKRAWFSQHHHYTKNFMPLYVAEACWKYNRRDRTDGFRAFLAVTVQ